MTTPRQTLAPVRRQARRRARVTVAPLLVLAFAAGCVGSRASRVEVAARATDPGAERRVQVVLDRADPIAAIASLAEVVSRTVTIERDGAPRPASLVLDDVPWTRALAVLAEVGECRLERHPWGSLVVQRPRPDPRAAFLRFGHLRGPGPASDDVAALSGRRGPVEGRYVAHDRDGVGLLVQVRGRARLETFLLPRGDPGSDGALRRERVMALLATALEGDPLCVTVRAFKGREQVADVLGR